MPHIAFSIQNLKSLKMSRVYPLLLCCLSITKLSAQVNIIPPVAAFSRTNASINTGVLTWAISASASEAGSIASCGVGSANYTSVTIRPSGNGLMISNVLF